jgi:hypothetical protein
MASPPVQAPDDAYQLVRALSRWDNEGGAGEDGPQVGTVQELRQLPLENEVVALRIRVIALENLAIALLAAGNGAQRQVAQRMVNQLAPDGTMPQRITAHAAAHMGDLIEQAVSIRAEQLG